MTVRIDALIFQPMDAGSPPRPLRTARRLICRAPSCKANAARRAVQKPGICASLSQRRNRAALRDDFKQKHTPPFRSAHRRKSGCPHRKWLRRGAPYIRPTPSRSQSDAHRLCAETELLFATVSSRSTLPVPLCASPEKRVSAQRAAPAARSLYTVNAARRAAQKPE